jgi:orotidine-5'-phosphate decarboxylase
MTDNPICLVLDSPDRTVNERLIEQTHESVGMYKVGLTVLYGCGIEWVRATEWPHPLFLDAKLHDIPAQVAGAVEALRLVKPRLVTAHASGGEEMLRAAVKAAADEIEILGMTVLTSLHTDDLAALGWDHKAEDLVLRLAQVAIEAGVAGLVSSPLEVGALRARFGARADGGPLLVTPGIRPAGSDPGDQRRTLGPREAIAAGADVLVVGRPITAADDPAAAAQAMLDEVSA